MESAFGFIGAFPAESGPEEGAFTCGAAESEPPKPGRSVSEKLPPPSELLANEGPLMEGVDIDGPYA